MTKQEMLDYYGDKKVYECAGILHNYTKDGTLNEHEALEKEIKKWKTLPLKEAMPFLEKMLYF